MAMNEELRSIDIPMQNNVYEIPAHFMQGIQNTIVRCL